MFQRMLVERIENRILVGIVAFVGILLLVGWTAIKENARMASFENQFEARSVERGAKLFASNCSTCHGVDGRGLQGRAPGLNNPHLFGHDFYGEVKNKLATLDTPINAARAELNALQNQTTALQTEKTTLEGEQTQLATELQSAADERVTEIETRQGEIATRLGEIETETEALAARIAPLQEQIDAYVAEHQAEYDAIIAEQAAIDEQLLNATINGYPDRATLDANPNWFERLNQANWSSTLESFLTTTLIHGRTQNAPMWGGNFMAAWSNRAGGPLRDDQISDLVAYIMNWNKGDAWTVEDLLAVNQFAQVPGTSSGEVTGEPAGDDVTAIFSQIEGGEVVGDPTRGEAIYNNREPSQVASLLGCAGCHLGGVQAPATETQWEQIPADRLTMPQFASYTFEHYVVESIVQPQAYIVPGFESQQMPSNFGERMSVQDIADVIEYLKSFNPDYVAPENPTSGDDADADTETSTDAEGSEPSIDTEGEIPPGPTPMGGDDSGIEGDTPSVDMTPTPNQ